MRQRDRPGAPPADGPIRPRRRDLARMLRLRVETQALHHRLHPNRIAPPDASRLAAEIAAHLPRWWNPCRRRRRAVGWQHGGMLCGYLLYGVTVMPRSGRRAAPDRVLVADIVVAPALRRRGVATAMLSAMLDELGKGPVQIFAHCWEGNPASRAFFERAGFLRETSVMRRDHRTG